MKRTILVVFIVGIGLAACRTGGRGCVLHVGSTAARRYSTYDSTSLVVATGYSTSNAAIETLQLERAVGTSEGIIPATTRAIKELNSDELEQVVLGPRGLTITDVRDPGPTQGIPELKDAASERDDCCFMQIARSNDGFDIVANDGTKHKVAAMPEVVDRLVANGSAKGSTLHIQFKGFTADEARGVMRASEIRTSAHYVGVLKQDPEFAAKMFNFSNVRIYDPTFHMLASGAAEIAINVEVLLVSKPSLWIRIKIALSQVSPDWLRTAATKAHHGVCSVLGRYVNKQSTPQQVGAELHRELKKLLPKKLDRCEVELKLEASDIKISKRDVEHEHGASHRAG